MSWRTLGEPRWTSVAFIPAKRTIGRMLSTQPPADPRTDSGRADASEGERPARAGARSLPLLWRVFIADGLVLAFVVLLLAVTPVTISAPIALDQLTILIAGMAVMLIVDFLLLQRVLSPLRQLTEMMRSVTPDEPGLRLTEIAPHDAEVATVTRALNDMLDRLEAERQASGRAALAAQERERGRIARELHDEIGQSLTAVLIHAERVATDGSADAHEELRRVASDVRLSLDDVRRIARRLRPEALDDLGLVNALIALCSRMADHSGLRIERRLPAGLPFLGSDAELVVYRVAQEGLNNVVRHANASDAMLSLRIEGDSLVLTVADDGRGLPPEVRAGSAGISGMRERALLVNGRLTIQPRPGGGTEVRLEIPGNGGNG